MLEEVSTLNRIEDMNPQTNFMCYCWCCLFISCRLSSDMLRPLGKPARSFEFSLASRTTWILGENVKSRKWRHHQGNITMKTLAGGGNFSATNISKKPPWSFKFFLKQHARSFESKFSEATRNISYSFKSDMLRPNLKGSVHEETQSWLCVRLNRKALDFSSKLKRTCPRGAQLPRIIDMFWLRADASHKHFQVNGIPIEIRA